MGPPRSRPAAPTRSGRCSLRKKTVSLDEDWKILPPVEFARTRLIDGSLQRTVERDSAGSTVEVYNTEPILTPQMKESMTFIFHRLLEARVGEEANRRQLHEAELCLVYLNPVDKQSDWDILTPGYRLAVRPIWQEFSAADLDHLRDVAFKAATELMSGGDATSVSLTPFTESNGPDAASLIHRKLKGRRIEQPFVFEAGTGREIEFSGFFGGEDEVNSQHDSERFDGFIKSVVYRGKTLSFDFERSTGGRSIQVEFSPRHREPVHAHAGSWLAEVTIHCEVRSSKKVTGQTTMTYTLISIGDLERFQFSNSDDFEFGPELVSS